MRKLYLLFLLLAICLSAKAQSPGAAIDVQHYGFYIQLSDSTNLIKGKADIALKFLKDVSSFTINLVKKDDSAHGMLVSGVTENGSKLPFVQYADVLNISTDAITGSEHTYTISYEGIPGDGLIISASKFGKRTFFGDNWPDRAHDWLPCVDDPADKATVDFIVTAPDHYEVVSNGLKIEETLLPGNLKLSHWKETALISTKVMVIGVAGFAVDHTGDINGIPVYSYVFPENKAAGFRDYAMAKGILAFYINKIGPYAYEKLANVQSKTIFDGMENASAIFYVENSVGDSGLEALMAHEIAHQWFGDAVTEKSFVHLWLSEGFATYMSNIYLENKYGSGIFNKQLIKNRDRVLNFEQTMLVPVVDTTIKSDYMQLLNANSYQKGSWVLHMLQHKLGDDTFWKGIRAYYAKYNGSNANTGDFRMVMEQVSGQSLKQFFKQWLYTAGHPQLKIEERIDPKGKFLNIKITQQQDTLYEMPLEYMLGKMLKTVNLKNRVTTIKIPNDSLNVKIDPNVNLLATFEISRVE